jgi:hypothetical protein
LTSFNHLIISPGVHWLQDPRSRIYNFTPWLQRIPKVNDFAFERLTGFVSSSRDEVSRHLGFVTFLCVDYFAMQDLRELARREKRQFAGSTSSLSGMLSHIYFLLSEFKDADISIMSQHFSHEVTQTSFFSVVLVLTLTFTLDSLLDLRLAKKCLQP